MPGMPEAPHEASVGPWTGRPRGVIIGGKFRPIGPTPKHELAPGQQWIAQEYCPHVDDPGRDHPHVKCPAPSFVWLATEPGWKIPPPVPKAKRRKGDGKVMS